MFPIKQKIMEGTAKKVRNKELPILIEGVDIYDVLCPVNKLTGCRANPLDLLQSISNDPKRSRLLDALMVELPTIACDSRLSDDDKIDMMMSRLNTGCPAEDDLYRSQLEKIAEPLFKSLGASEKEAKQAVDSTIEFNNSDKEIIENA